MNERKELVVYLKVRLSIEDIVREAAEDIRREVERSIDGEVTLEDHDVE